MRGPTFGLSLVLAVALAQAAAADYSFDTLSTATQTLNSPAFGGSISITSTGTQHFTGNLTTHVATVTSSFHGSDLPDPSNPGGFVSYDLYNTATTGAVTQNPDGSYAVGYSLLFELKVTSGALAGLTFETMQDAIFANASIPTAPFPPGTAFSDPSGTDTVGIYIKVDPTGTFAPGTLVGTSSGRIVTVNSVVPEPSSAALLAIGAGLFGAVCRRKNKSSDSMTEYP